jgi:hypothetical protein
MFNVGSRACIESRTIPFKLFSVSLVTCVTVTGGVATHLDEPAIFRAEMTAIPLIVRHPMRSLRYAQTNKCEIDYGGKTTIKQMMGRRLI